MQPLGLGTTIPLGEKQLVAWLFKSRKFNSTVFKTKYFYNNSRKSIFDSVSFRIVYGGVISRSH